MLRRKFTVVNVKIPKPMRLFSLQVTDKYGVMLPASGATGHERLWILRAAGKALTAERTPQIRAHQKHGH
jgi:hypothetical protein